MTEVKDVPISAEGLLVLTWLLNAIVFVFMFLRLMLHRRQGLKTPAIILSDIMLVASWIFGVTSISTDAWKYNLEIEGRSRELQPSELTVASKLSFLCGYLVFSAMWLAKGAFIAYFFHLFPNLPTKFKGYLFFVTAFTASTFITTVLLQSLWCLPIHKNWTGECNATGNHVTLPLWSFLNIATDIFILLLPLCVLRTLPLEGKRQIIALVIVFCIGGLSIFAACARFVVIYPKVRKNDLAPIVHTYELWALIEITTSQLAVSLPALRAYLRIHKDRKTGWRNHHTKSPELGFSGPIYQSWLIEENESQNSAATSQGP